MPKLVKVKYIRLLRAKLAELRAEKLTDSEIVAALNGPVLEREADEQADPPVAAVYGPSWARSIGLGELLPEFIGQVDAMAGLTEPQVADECAKLLLEACLVRSLAAEEKTVADARAEVAEGEEPTRWERVAAIVEAYTGVDERRAETLATGLLASATETEVRG